MQISKVIEQTKNFNANEDANITMTAIAILVLCTGHYQASSLVCLIKNKFAYFSTKTYVVGTQKNRLDETVLLSTQHIC